MEAKDLWDLETALKVLAHDSVDSALWAEAVEWLILYGPLEIRQLLLDASMTATISSFPELKPTHYSPDGQACYNIGQLAGSLGIDEEEARKILQQKEAEHQLLQMFKDDDSNIVH